jgi:hypothetical protein
MGERVGRSIHGTNPPRYQLDRRMGGTQNRSRWYGEETNVTAAGIEPRLKFQWNSYTMDVHALLWNQP